MLQISRWRVALVILAAVWGLIFALPNVLPERVRGDLPDFLPKSAVNLGLDLRGGSHLLLEVDVDAVVAERLETEVENMAVILRDAKPRIGYTGRAVVGDAARLRPLNPEDQTRALDLIRKAVQDATPPGADAEVEVSVAGDGAIETRMTNAGVSKITSDAVTRSIEVIRRRIDELGTAEITITRQGADRIIVQAPGESDPEALKRRIGQTAKMSFHMVDASVTAADAAAGIIPPGSKILPQDDPQEPAVVVRSRAELTGDDLIDAQPTFNQDGDPVVSFRFNQRGARKFCQITTRNAGQRFATVLDDKVITAPRINEPICGGNGQIYGGFTVETANELAVLLRAGALPAPLNVIEQRTVGAELGQDAINAGAIAGVAALIVTAVFMLMAYGGLFGGIAITALLINFTMIIAAMSMIGATLTLPGIAGLILTIAMAVDANVLIYERMRDEVRAGRGPAIAIDAGFGKAIVTIMDANITTILAALILFQYGAGPVRGFAWTLSIGVVTSVFTAVLVTQVLLGLWFRTTRPKTLPI
jgi:preprotein translocase subunit SecD